MSDLTVFTLRLMAVEECVERDDVKRERKELVHRLLESV